MDHNDHDGMEMGDSINGSKTCPMIMTFHAGHCERILWNGWVASTVTEFVFSALAIFLMSLLYAGLRFLREYVLHQTIKKEAELQRRNGQLSACHGPNMAEISERSYVEKIFSKPHILQTLLNFVQIILSYLLMLIFMTFNYWLCLAVVLGLGIGFFLFGWIRQDLYEDECC